MTSPLKAQQGFLKDCRRLRDTPQNLLSRQTVSAVHPASETSAKYLILRLGETFSVFWTDRDKGRNYHGAVCNCNSICHRINSKNAFPEMTRKAFDLIPKPPKMGLVLRFQVKRKTAPHLLALFLIPCLLLLAVGAAVRASLTTKCAAAVPA